MQAKLFAWTNCSVAEFMLKLPYPPPFAIVRAGITQLKVIDRTVFQNRSITKSGILEFRSGG